MYDLDRVQRATVDAVTVGRVPGGWSAAGARYVLPAVASYATADAGAPRPGGLALDRGTAPDSLVVHEETAPDEEGPTRLWRYAFGPRPDRGALLRPEPVAAYETELTRVRGVLAHGPDWYVSRAAGTADERGTLWRQNTEGADPVRCGRTRRTAAGAGRRRPCRTGRRPGTWVAVGADAVRAAAGGGRRGTGAIASRCCPSPGQAFDTGVGRMVVFRT